MVKLFVGNLAEGIDSDRLRDIFEQHVRVQECDVLKNFAFVHVESEDDADIAVERFNKYKLQGKELHVERSTSNLRKQPGMSDKCFTCGAEEHKTSQCPSNPNARKRNLNSHQHEPLGKKPRPLIFASQPVEEYRIIQQQHQPQYLQQPAQIAPTMVAMQQQFVPSSQATPMGSNSWGYKLGGGADADPELPCPQNAELQRLYEQYMESRTRYFFYREQLTKELRLQQPQATQAPPPSVYPSNANGSAGNGTDRSYIRVDLTNFVRSNGQTAPIITTRSLMMPAAEQQQPAATNPAPNPYSSGHLIHISQQSSAIPNPYSSSAYSSLQGVTAPPNANPSGVGGGINPMQMPTIHLQHHQQQHVGVKSEPSPHLGGVGMERSVSGVLPYASASSYYSAAQPSQAYQNTYSGAATHYSTLPPPQRQQQSAPTMAPPKQHPTPLASIQPFGYNNMAK